MGAAVAAATGCSGRSVEDGALWHYTTVGIVEAHGMDPAVVEEVGKRAVAQRDPSKEPSLLDSARKLAASRLRAEQGRDLDAGVARNVTVDIAPLKVAFPGLSKEEYPPKPREPLELWGAVHPTIVLVPPDVATEVGSPDAPISLAPHGSPRLVAVVRVAGTSSWRDVEAARSTAALITSLGDAMQKRLADDLAARLFPGRLEPEARSVQSARYVELPDEFAGQDPWGK